MLYLFMFGGNSKIRKGVIKMRLTNLWLRDSIRTPFRFRMDFQIELQQGLNSTVFREEKISSSLVETVETMKRILFSFIGIIKKENCSSKMSLIILEEHETSYLIIIFYILERDEEWLLSDDEFLKIEGELGKLQADKKISFIPFKLTLTKNRKRIDKRSLSVLSPCLTPPDKRLIYVC